MEAKSQLEPGTPETAKPLAANGALPFPWARGPHDQAMNVSCQCENEWMQISFQSKCHHCAGAMQTVSTAANVSNSSLRQ